MVTIKVLSKTLVEIHPKGPLTTEDIKLIENKVNPLIETFGSLQLLIFAESFKGWKNFQGFKAHLCFVKNHHQEVTKIAMITDRLWQKCLMRIVKFFLHPSIREFSAHDLEGAKKWLNG